MSWSKKTPKEETANKFGRNLLKFFVTRRKLKQTYLNVFLKKSEILKFFLCPRHTDTTNRMKRENRKEAKKK